MQLFHVWRVELDLCPECGGVWVDRNGVERAVGRRLAETPREGTSWRQCAACRKPLTLLVLAGEQVESCASCRGVYLDKGELDQLATRRVPLQGPALKHSPEGTVLSFQCPRCGGEFPAELGYPRGRGLVCTECAPAFGVQKRSPSRGGGSSTNEWVGGGVIEVLVELLFS
jgi:Zn-finger nucleic acid-binding protein